MNNRFKADYPAYRPNPRNKYPRHELEPRRHKIKDVIKHLKSEDKHEQ